MLAGPLFKPLQSTRPGPVSSIRNEAQLEIWLNHFEHGLEQISAAYNAVSYNRYLMQPAKITSDLNQLDASFGKMFANRAYREIVGDWLIRTNNPLLKRRLDLLKLSFVDGDVSKSPQIYKLRNSISEQLLSYKPSYNGRSLSRTDVAEALRQMPDQTVRQSIFEQTLSPLAKNLEPLVKELMHRRNILAQALGYSSYTDLHFELIGLSQSTIISHLERLEYLTRVPYQAYLEEVSQNAGLKRLEQWDLNFLADRFVQIGKDAFPQNRILESVSNLLSLFQLNTRDLKFEIQTGNIPFGGLCFSIRIPDDIRILYQPKDGYLSYRTLIHEFGHALHFAFNRQPHYILKREPAPFNEGMAEVLAYFTQQQEWLTANTPLSGREAEQFVRESKFRRILRLRSLIAQAQFEIEAYDNLEADLELLNARIEARLFLTPLNLTPRWAASSFPTTHPLYRQNYVIGEMIASQTHTALQEKFGSLWKIGRSGSADTFGFLAESFYNGGALLPWPEKILRATGGPLSTESLAAELCS